MGLMLRVLLSLGLVMAALWFAARAARKWSSGFRLAGRTTRPGLVEARVGLSRTAGLTVVRFGDRRLLIAANERTVKVLAEEVVPDAADTTVVPAASLRDALTPVLDVVSRITARRPSRTAAATAATTSAVAFHDVLAGVAAPDEQPAPTTTSAPQAGDPLAAAVEASMKPASILETLRVVTARYEA